jgi:hypothetical protein
MTWGFFERRWVRDGTAALLLLSLFDLLIHLAASGRYGYFRDELYFNACGRHLAWGYVDQPPLVALVARISQGAMGHSLFALRFRPAVTGAATIFLTGWIARELGGGRFAQILAATAALLAPLLLAFGSYFSMNAFEPLFWTACAWTLVRVLKRADARLWLLFGGIAGLGLLNKYTMLVFGFGVVAGLLLTEGRAQLRSRWIWIGGGIALAMALPSFAWQAAHHWPQIEVVRNAQAFENVPVPAWKFLWEQALFLNPVAAPIAVLGVGWLFFAAEGKRYRAVGWAVVATLAIFMVTKGKPYYAMPVWPAALAAGGVACERLFAGRGWRRVGIAYGVIVALAGIATLPFGVPVLPVETFIRYSQALPMAQQAKTERDAGGPLPQLYADMFGWEELAETVGRVYNSLPAEERAKCAILAGNAGEAGAIDLFGAKYGLPNALSGHDNYFLWGTHGYTGEVVILFGPEVESKKGLWGDVREAAVTSNPLGMPLENGLRIYICRKPQRPLAEMWPEFKDYI